MPTKKRALACRVSNETFDAVKELTEGDNPPYESTSEYLYTLILSDLGQRKSSKKTTVDELKEMLKMPEIRDLIKSIARE